MADKENAKKENDKKKDSDETKEEELPKGKITNVPPGGNIMSDSFFDTLGDIDDDLGNLSFSKLGEDTPESLDDALQDSSLNLGTKNETNKKLSTKSLPASTLPGNSKIKEKMMNKKGSDPLNLGDDDPNAKQINEIWQSMSETDASEFKLMVLRLEPQTIKGTKISGYLQTFHLPTTIPDIIEQIGQKYGGGKYQIRIVNGAGQYVKSKTFEISGLPKVVSDDEKDEEEDKLNNNTNSSSNQKTTNSSNNSSNDDEDEEEIDDDWPDDEVYTRPRPSFGSPYNQSPYQQPFQSPYAPSNGFNRTGYQSPYMRDKDDFDSDKVRREVEEKVVSKIESKFDKMADMMQNMVMMNQNKKESFFDADVVKALAPVVVTWLDSKSSRDSSNVGQFSEMNKQMVGLMEGMQNLVRIGDKSKEDFSEKERRAREEFAERERREREAARRESLEHQRQMEEKFLEERRRSEERHQAMLIQMKESLESKHQVAMESTTSSQLQFEKMRQEYREKEERQRLEAREREERLREEARKRDEESRRKEMEFWQAQRSEEMRWREEMRLKEEEARQRELQWREEIRQREIEKERELKLRELEMMKTIQDMNNQKAGMQQKLIEQVYNNNNNNRESQLQMEMAIARMTSDNEARMMQANAEMQLEKIRHATQMQMTKMKSDMQAIESKKDDDPLDSAMQDYLKRRLQIDMIKELNMDVAEDEVPSGGIMGIAKKLLSDGAGPMLLQMLLGGGGGGMPGMMNPGTAAPAPGGRVVAPNPVPTPRPVTPTPTPQPQETNIHDLDDYDDEIDDEDVEDYDDEDTEEEETSETQNISPPDVDLYQEIPRVAEFFEYLKGAIESGSISEKEAAEEGKARLSPEIIEFLMQIKDSRIVISQLYPLLSNLGGEEFAQFFNTEACYAFMDKMLLAMAGEDIDEAEEPDEDDEPPKVVKKPQSPKPTPKADSPPKASKSTKATPKKEVPSKVEEEAAGEKATEAQPKKTRKPRKKKTSTT